MPTYDKTGVCWLYTNVPLIKNKHQRQFDNVQQQDNFFGNYVAQSFDHISYTREDFIKLNVDDDIMRYVNYLAFKNTNNDNKLIYGFITDIRYANDGMCYVYYDIDYYQTYLFDINFNKTFIEREHTYRFKGDGTPNINIQKENLFVGNEYLTTNTIKYEQLQGFYFITVITKQSIDEDSSEYEGVNLGGVNTPLNYYIIPVRDDGSMTFVNGLYTPVNPRFLYNYLATDDKLVNMVVSIYASKFVPINVYLQNTTVMSPDLELVRMKGEYLGNKVLIPRLKNKTSYNLTTYTINNVYNNFPRYSESKLYMYPYSFMEITDNKGNSVNLQMENMTDGNNLHLYIKSSLGTSATAMIGATYYNNLNANHYLLDNTVTTKGNNDIPVVNDYTATYFQGNKNSLIGSGVLAVGGIVGGALTGNVPVAIGGLFSAVNTIGDIADANNKPPSLQNLQNANMFSIQNGLDGFFIHFKTVHEDIRNTLENFFFKFGYKVNKLKYPNLHTRSSFNYIKTVDCSFTGKIPYTGLEEIRKMFDDGITLWHINNIGNYDIGNGEV